MNTALLFELGPDQQAWRRRNSIDAIHWRKLPGISCRNCGVWAQSGIVYPNISPSDFEGVLLQIHPTPVPVQEFDSLAASVQAVVGAERPVRPGTDLGPLKGRATGIFGDFAWVNPWTPLVRESVWLALRKTGTVLQGKRAELDFETPVHERLIEIEVLPSAKLANPVMSERCAECGRLSVKRSEDIVVMDASLDSCPSLQRIAELPTILVGNRSLVEFIQQRGLRDIIVKPVQVI